MSTNTVSSQPLLSYPEMASARTTSDGLVSWGGVAMNPARVYPKVPGMVFDAPGIGYFSVNGPGSQGYMDAWVTVAAVGSTRDICALVDGSQTTEILLGLDAAGHITATIYNAAGTSVATFTGTTVYASGTRLHIRLAWNSLVAIGSPYYMTLTVNDQAAAGTFTGTSSWTAFAGAFLSVGGKGPLPFALNPFNGTVESVQLGIG